MKRLILWLALVPFFQISGVTLEPKTDYSESKFKSVAASSEDTGGGVVVPNGETVGIYRVIANGADPSAYVSVVYCDGDPSKEKIFISTKGDIDARFDVSLSSYQVTGDGVCKLIVKITNNNVTATPVIGGAFYAVKL